MDGKTLRRGYFWCALALMGAGILATIARGEAPPGEILPAPMKTLTPALSHGEREMSGFVEGDGEDGWWLPFRTLPEPGLWEQLWKPGDLVEDTYWLRRPWSAGLFIGTMDGSELASDIDQGADWFWGLRLGNDFAPHWGWEVRSGFFNPELSYDGQPGRLGKAHDWFLDVNVLNYPWGDTRIRPYWSIGLGAAQFQFADERGSGVDDWVVDLPLAIGCKYYYTPWLTLRAELGDTICFGGQTVDAANYLSFTVGAEVH